ncbi:PaaI family thioesterase [Desulfonatronovibrio hydrogenovorans]|uniref:PaaI family thioesterase n=1 Tax=Desulfonatronovibrio hydrogenovorans TaxID=53245 RepID=UPI00048CF39A|nr:PaaI family thioesterase [Desulfonatronovibrio hydrogenovorans]
MNDSYTQLISYVENQMPFNKHLGIRIRHLEKGFARLYLPYQPEFTGDPRRPALHGGVLSTLVDTCGGVAIWTCCEVEDAIATIDMRVDYLRPAPQGSLFAEARVRLLGNRVGNVQTIIYAQDCQDRIIAEGRAVYNIRRRTKS